MEMILLSQTHTADYINRFIIPAICAVVVAGLGFRFHDKLFKLQQNEDISVFKAIQIAKKYIFLMILATIIGAGSFIQTLDSYFK